MMSRADNPVWVLAEQISGKTPRVCFELIGKARKLADDLGVFVEVLLLGEVADDQLDLLYQSGADTIYHGVSPDYELYQPEIYSETIVKQAKKIKPQIILLGSTFIGRELAPIIAAKLKQG